MNRSYSAYLPGVIIFVLFLTAGLMVYDDYGVAFDEPAQREIGLVSYNYIFNADDRLLNYIERDHGVGFELPLVILEKALGIDNERDVYLMRHLASHLSFLSGSFFLYLLLLKLFRSKVIASLGYLSLLLHPRIYAHSFFNSKDIPFLTVTIVALFFAWLAFSRKRPLWFLVLGAVCGYATSIRLPGVMLVVFISVFMCIELARAARQRNLGSNLIVSTLLFILGFAGILYAAWPTLWQAPLTSFVACFQSLAHFRWDGCYVFGGERFVSPTMFWYYLPVWFGVTMPLLVLFAGMGGFVLVVVKAIRKPKVSLIDSRQKNLLLYALSFVGPFMAIIGLGSVVYDDWRHIYFVYPSFILLAMNCLHSLSRTRWKTVVVAVYAVQTIFMAVFLFRAHPFQQVYFNRLVSHEHEYLRKHYDYDYWGASYKQAIDYVLAHDDSPQIRLYYDYPPLVNNYLFLPPEDKKRIVLTDERPEGTYFITAFRCETEDYRSDIYKYRIFHDFKVQNSTVVRIYKLEP